MECAFIFPSCIKRETHSSFLQHSSVQITHKFWCFFAVPLAFIEAAAWRFLFVWRCSDVNEKSLTSSIVKKDVSDLDDCPEESGAIVLIGFVPLLLASDHENWVEKFGMHFKIWSIVFCEGYCGLLANRIIHKSIFFGSMKLFLFHCHCHKFTLLGCLSLESAIIITTILLVWEKLWVLTKGMLKFMQ